MDNLDNSYKNMMDSVIRKYGMESQESIDFCRLCEKRRDMPRIVRKQYNKLMKGSVIK